MLAESIIFAQATLLKGRGDQDRSAIAFSEVRKGL